MHWLTLRLWDHCNCSLLLKHDSNFIPILFNKELFHIVFFYDIKSVLFATAMMLHDIIHVIRSAHILFAQGMFTPLRHLIPTLM